MSNETDTRQQAYLHGFAVKCAEIGVDPEALVKAAKGKPFFQAKATAARIPAKSGKPKSIASREYMSEWQEGKPGMRTRSLTQEFTQEGPISRLLAALGIPLR